MTFILSAFEIKKIGKTKQLESKDLILNKLKSKSLAWAHLDANKLEGKAWLQENIDYLDPLVLDALFAEETRPRVIQNGNGILIILRGMNLNQNADPEDMVSLRIWIDSERIISTQRRNLKALKDVQIELEKGTGPKNAGDFLVDIISFLFHRMAPTLNGMEETLDELEDISIENPKFQFRQNVMDLRRKAVTIRKYMLPQKDAIYALKQIKLKWISETNYRKLNETHDQLLRYVESIESVRDRSQIIAEEITNAQAEKMNRNLYTLSLVTIIFLPIGFLTGLFGINVGGMPGVENINGFWYVTGMCGFLAAIGLALLKLFRLY